MTKLVVLQCLNSALFDIMPKVLINTVFSYVEFEINIKEQNKRIHYISSRHTLNTLHNGDVIGNIKYCMYYRIYEHINDITGYKYILKCYDLLNNTDVYVPDIIQQIYQTYGIYYITSYKKNIYVFDNSDVISILNSNYELIDTIHDISYSNFINNIYIKCNKIIIASSFRVQVTIYDLIKRTTIQFDMDCLYNLCVYRNEIHILHNTGYISKYIINDKKVTKCETINILSEITPRYVFKCRNKYYTISKNYITLDTNLNVYSSNGEYLDSSVITLRSIENVKLLFHVDDNIYMITDSSNIIHYKKIETYEC